jgi:hypothetical protein
MYGKSSIINRLKKIEDKMQLSDDKDLSTLMVINVDRDNDYYFIDDEGNKQQISEDIYNQVVKRQIKRFKGHIPIAVKIVDNEDLEQVLWDSKDI